MEVVIFPQVFILRVVQIQELRHGDSRCFPHRFLFSVWYRSRGSEIEAVVILPQGLVFHLVLVWRLRHGGSHHLPTGPHFPHGTNPGAQTEVEPYFW